VDHRLARDVGSEWIGEGDEGGPQGQKLASCFAVEVHRLASLAKLFPTQQGSVDLFEF
jgi:hypothetical protein